MTINTVVIKSENKKKDETTIVGYTGNVWQISHTNIGYMYSHYQGACNQYKRATVWVVVVVLCVCFFFFWGGGGVEKDNKNVSDTPQRLLKYTVAPLFCLLTENIKYLYHVAFYKFSE